MDDSTESERSGQIRGEDQRRSRNASDHIGWLKRLVGFWVTKTPLRRFEPDELLSIAYIEADDLLTRKYRPEISTAAFFLSRFLYSRVQYRALTLLEGNRKRPAGWMPSAVFSCENLEAFEIASDELDSSQDLTWADLIDLFHPDVRSVVARIAGGLSIDEIVEEDFSMPLFEYMNEGNSIDEHRSDLILMLRSEYRRLFR